MIACVIAWVAIQARLGNTGIPTRSRGSMRYQRRKARQLGLDPQDMAIQSSRGSRHFPEDNNTLITDVFSAIIRSILALLFSIASLIFMMAHDIELSWWLALMLVLFIISFVFRRR
jgi:uncharacterized membrane protein YhaH (DUF805 family)